MRFCLQLYFICVLFAAGTADAQPLRIAVASNFKAPLQQVVSEFEKIYQIKVSLSSASSGVLYQQISHGAPFDLFLSADEYRPSKLIEYGLAIAASKRVYAIGELAFYSPNQYTSLSQLNNDETLVLAIANGKHAPYGIATQAYLEKYFETLSVKTVTTNNIAQTFQVVHSGNAKAGFVALSHLLAHNVAKSDYQILNTKESSIAQYAVVISASRQQDKAQQFLSYLSSVSVQQQLSRWGYH